MLNANWIKWAEDIHNTLYGELSETKDRMAPKTSEELTDIGFICKELYGQIDDLRKRIKEVQELAEKLACLKGATERLNSFHGTLATGTPCVEMSANLPHPKKSPEEYLALCAYLGIPDQMIQNDLFRLHWPGFREFFTKEMAAGKPLPPGINLEKVYSHHKLRYRKKT